MSKKIVIVDDDNDLLRLLAAAFKAQNFEVKAISSGQEAMNYLMDEKNTLDIQLIILDRLLPDMDGMDIMRTFRQKFADKIPILILSVLSAEKDVTEGLEKGAVDYISKPFSIHVFMQKVKKLLVKP
jgi:DNA-binding response OmpR family regulator